jgi:hypothetical protein
MPLKFLVKSKVSINRKLPVIQLINVTFNLNLHILLRLRIG